MIEQNTFISNWLENPHQITSAEHQQLNELLEHFPYFVPAQWMQSKEQYTSEGFSKDLLHRSHLFMGNWMNFYSAMNSSATVLNKAEIINQHDEHKVEETAEEILNNEESLILDENMPERNTRQEENTEDLIQPLYVDNYFQHQGIDVSDEIPEIVDEQEDEKSLLVMMGFDEWLLFLKKKNEAKKSEEEDKAMLRSMWQREKLATAMGEEDDNIPEAVFEMAINSIDKQDIMVSEPLAEIHIKQGKYEKAIEIYRKLSLQNPEKKTYFAAKINHLNKENLL